MKPELTKEAEFSLLYRGNSMRACFRAMERLRVRRCGSGDLRRGDVVVFVHRTDGVKVIHRVDGRRDGRWWTRGDDRLRRDRDPLADDLLLGRVTHVWRNGQWRPVKGGWPGWVRAKGVWGMRLLQAVVTKVTK